MKKPIAYGVIATLSLFAVGATPVQAQSVQPPAQAELAVAPPVFLQLEIMSACNGGDALLKITNRGGKWPQAGFLRLYYTDDRSLISERRIRLNEKQTASFVVRRKIALGRPIGLWIAPGWYKRDFSYDAAITCE